MSEDDKYSKTASELRERAKVLSEYMRKWIEGCGVPHWSKEPFYTEKKIHRVKGSFKRNYYFDVKTGSKNNFPVSDRQKMLDRNHDYGVMVTSVDDFPRLHDKANPNPRPNSKEGHTWSFEGLSLDLLVKALDKIDTFWTEYMAYSKGKMDEFQQTLENLDEIEASIIGDKK